MGITVFIGAVTTVLLLIFALFSFKMGKNSKLSNLFLGLFLLSNFMYLLSFISPQLGEFLNFNLGMVYQFGKPFCFLFGPLLYLFTLAITNNNYRFPPASYLHFLPFIFFFVASYLSIDVINTNIFLIFNFQVFFYLFSCVRVIRNLQERLKHYFSSIDKINFVWLLYIVGAFILMWLIDLLTYSLMGFGMITELVSDWLTLVSILINLTFIIILFFKALQEPQFFYITRRNSQEKYYQSNLSQEIKRSQLEKLQNHFDEEQPYLNASLTISDVSESLNVSVKNLSQIINELLDKNFYDFTNSFRIKSAKEKLILPENRHKTILEILYDSGFNSKSAFNAAFKKHTGFTPSEFRRQNSQY